MIVFVSDNSQIEDIYNACQDEKKIVNYNENIPLADAVVFNGITKKVPYSNTVIWGGEKRAILLENNDFLFDVCKVLKIKTPRKYQFKNYEETEKFIKRYPSVYIYENIEANTPNSQDLLKFLHKISPPKWELIRKVKGYKIQLVTIFVNKAFIPLYCFIFLDDNWIMFYWSSYLPTRLEKLFEAFTSFLQDRFTGFLTFELIVNSVELYVVKVSTKIDCFLNRIMSKFIVWDNILKKFDFSAIQEFENQFFICGLIENILKYRVPIDTQEIPYISDEIKKGYLIPNGKVWILAKGQTLTEGIDKLLNNINKFNSPQIFKHNIGRYIKSKIKERNNWLKSMDAVPLKVEK